MTGTGVPGRVPQSWLFHFAFSVVHYVHAHHIMIKDRMRRWGMNMETEAARVALREMVHQITACSMNMTTAIPSST